MERVYRFPAAAFLDTFCPDEFADTTPDPNHRVQPPLHRPKHPKAARDFDEVDIGGSDELWDYSFAEAFNASAMCPEHTLVMGHDEEDVFGALYDDGDDVPENDTNVQWGLIQACFLFFEQDDDPFAPEDSISHLSDAFTRRHRKHQLYVSTFVARVLSRQQHTHLFLLVISGASARIVRADREAFFATHTFSYKTAPERSVLRDFFRRFTNMGRAGRGIDTTALLLREGLLGSTGERIGFMREMADHELDGAADHARTCDKKSLDEDWPWYSVTVEGLEFLIAKPSAYSDKPSRPSRGYIGLCFSAGPRHGTFVWLKDTWRRILDNEYEQEGAVLSDLNRLGVQNVPTLVCHGDVSNHRLNLKETLVRLHKQKPKHVRSRVERVHYRVVTEEVGLPIEDFGNGRELAVLFRDCLQAHRNACERARILHRDISEGNLLMVPYDTQFDDGVGIAYKGMLIDWEYSERISKRSAPDFIYRVDRRGTWDFLSVNATNHPERPVQPVDDFESFFHVFVALGLSFLRHNCEWPTQFEADYFSTRTTSGGPWASALKERCVKHGRLLLGVEGQASLQFLKETRRKLPRSRIVETKLVSHPISGVFDAWLALIRDCYAGEKEINTLHRSLATGPVVPTAKENTFSGCVSSYNSPAAPNPHAPPLSSLELNIGVPFSEGVSDYDVDDEDVSELALHDAIIEALSDAIAHRIWPTLDKTPDQLEPEADASESDEVEEQGESSQLCDDEDNGRPSLTPERPSKRRRVC